MANEVVSLEAPLTERYEQQLDVAEMNRLEAKRHLATIAMIYNGQMHFDFEAAEAGQTA